MRYAIYNSETKLYYNEKVTSKWVEDINASQLFKNGDSIKNYARSTLNTFFKAGILVYTQVPETKTEEVKKDYTQEEADTIVNTFIDITKDLYSQVSSLVSFYANELSKIDGMQEDILHKVEFDNVGGLQAVLLIKKLKEIRIKRREIKDKLAQLKICEDGINMPKKFNSLNNRTYTPRSLTELFK